MDKDKIIRLLKLSLRQIQEIVNQDDLLDAPAGVEEIIKQTMKEVERLEKR